MRAHDFHCHLDPKAADGLTRLLSAMDRAEIERAVVVAGGTLSPAALSAGIRRPREQSIPVPNLQLLERCRGAAGRVVPFYFADPTAPVEGYAAVGSEFAGLKLGPAVHGVRFADERVVRYVAAAVRLRHPVYAHVLALEGFDVNDFVGLATRFPRHPFILGHAGVGQCDYQAISEIRAQSNISLETSGGFSALIRHAVSTLGSGRVLFGTEWPLQDMRVERLKLALLDLPDADLINITVKNFDTLLDGRLCATA